MNKEEKEGKCEFYPKLEDDCVCYAGSDISGTFICTKEFSKTCRYANEHRKLWKGGKVTA